MKKLKYIVRTIALYLALSVLFGWLIGADLGRMANLFVHMLVGELVMQYGIRKGRKDAGRLLEISIMDLLMKVLRKHGRDATVAQLVDELWFVPVNVVGFLRGVKP